VKTDPEFDLAKAKWARRTDHAIATKKNATNYKAHYQEPCQITTSNMLLLISKVTAGRLSVMLSFHIH